MGADVFPSEGGGVVVDDGVDEGVEGEEFGVVFGGFGVVFLLGGGARGGGGVTA